MQLCIKTLLLAISCALLLSPGVRAQVQSPPDSVNADIAKEIESLREDIPEIKSLLQKQQQGLPMGATRATKLPDIPKEEVVLPFVPRASLGNPNSRFVVVEFADLQCPFCSYFEKKSFKEFSAKSIDTGKVRFLSLEFPLESHPDATTMSLASVCAGDQGKYWEMRNSLFAAANLGEPGILNKLATAQKLDMPLFESCISSQEQKEELSSQAAQARQIGVSATPTFLVGAIESGKIRGHLIVGAVTADELTRQVDAFASAYEKEKT